MKIKAKDLQPGQVIRIEYGYPGNVINFTVDQVEFMEKMVVVYCNHGNIKGTPAFGLEEEVEVVS